MWLRWMLGGLVSRAIMPSSVTYPKRDVDPSELDVIKEVGDIKGVDILSIDRMVDSTGDAKIFFSEYQSRANYAGSYSITSDQKVIINAVGNGDCIGVAQEFFKNMAYSYPGCRVVGFDCRNVDRSKGTVRSEQDWIDDALAVVEYYHNVHGIAYNNMILYGHSLGAAILTMAAAQLYQRELNKARGGEGSIQSNHDEIPCVKLINSRSFRDISSIIAEYISLRGFTGGVIMGVVAGGIILPAGVLLGFALTYSLIAAGIALALMLTVGLVFHEEAQLLVKYILGVALYLMFGDLEAAKAYSILPEENRDYIFVKGDEVLRGAGLHFAMKEFYKAKKRALQHDIGKLKKEDTDEAKLKITGLEQELVRLWRRKLFTEQELQEHRIDQTKSANRHTVRLCELETWSKKIEVKDRVSGAKRLSDQLDIFLEAQESKAIATLNI